jgi:molybdopterin converting factor small subunit
VRTFARIREIVASDRLVIDVTDGATSEDLWRALIARNPALSELRSSTRVARNGRIVDADAVFADGDEASLLPPTGGG